MDQGPVATFSGGANQERVRAHNERLVLSLVRWNDGISKAEIARRSGLSAQTVTMIMRALEKDGLLVRGTPTKGRVGQPSTPMSLNPDGAFSYGLKIGRRNADLLLMDFTGHVRARQSVSYPYPKTTEVLEFVAQYVPRLADQCEGLSADRVVGLGVAMPFDMWAWADRVGACAADMRAWQDFDVVSRLTTATGLNVTVQNDCTAACGAELLFGKKRRVANFGYFFIGFFIGGGIVIGNTLQTGVSGNAGAFGTIRVTSSDGGSIPLLETASTYLLEDKVAAEGGNMAAWGKSGADWSGLEPHLVHWIATSARTLAEASLSVCSVFDFEAIVIDGNLPDNVRQRLVDATRQHLLDADARGIREFEVITGSLGHDAQVVGAATLPFMSRFLVDNSVLLKK